MKKFLTIVALCWLSLSGCRSGGRRDLIERDLRLQEDRIYELEEMLDQYEDQLECSRRENEALKTGGVDVGTSRSSGTGDTLSAPSVVLPPSGSTPGRSSRSAPVEPPVIELEPSAPAFPGTSPTPDGGSLRSFESGAMSQACPTKIVLNPRLTGGLNQDGCPGDEGILVVFEPRDARGNLVNVPGDVSIVVLDATKEGPAARVARWDFTADEALTHFRKSPFGSGMQFKMFWPGDPPTGSELHLFVRYTPIEGQRLAADTKFKIEPPQLASVDRAAASAWAPAVQKPKPPQAVTASSSRETVRVATATGPLVTEQIRSSTIEPPTAHKSDAVGPASSRPEKPVWKPYR